jgi:hypothetical protein
MRRFIGGWFIVMALALLGANASADDKVLYKKRTVIDLSAAVIEGELTRPEGSYIVNRKLSKFSDLIQDRQDFIDELMSSHNDL